MLTLSLSKGSKHSGSCSFLLNSPLILPASAVPRRRPRPIVPSLRATTKQTKYPGERMSSKNVLMTAVTAGLLLQALPAAAELEEVIVSARKRDESILKVPVVETALTADQLAQFATVDLYGVAERVPGLLFGSGTGSFGGQVSLRGVGTNTLNASIDQSVSLNIDGMQITQGLAYRAGMFDVQQVEVLRGPQALFYGKSSPGGVIAVRTANPTDELFVDARAGYEFEAEEKIGELILSGPVSDTLGLRLATSYSESEGFFRNEAIAAPGLGGLDPRYRNFAPKKDLLVRGTALWQPSGKFTAQLKANYAKTDIDGDGGGLQMVSCPEGTVSYTGIPFLGNGEDCRKDDIYRLVDMDPAYFPGIRNNGTPFSDLEQVFGTLELDYEFESALTLTAVTGYYAGDHSTSINGTITSAAGPGVAADTDFHRHDFTQEVRLTSDFDSPVNFTIGAFYQDGLMKDWKNLLGNSAIGLPGVLSRGVHNIEIDSISAFGQVRWRVLPTLELAAGARWTDEERTHSQYDYLTGQVTLLRISEDSLPTPEQTISSDNVSPELTVTYTPTDDLTLFAAYREAYKSGSFDTVSMSAPNSVVGFGDEKAKGYEAGLKTRLFDRTLNLNLSAYRYDYDDLQVGANETVDGVISIRTVNAASSEIYGADFDAAWRPRALTGLTLNAAVNYNHARYGTFDNAPCWGGQTIAMGCDLLFNEETGRYTSQDLSGRELLRAPEWSANAGFDYEFALAGDRTLVFAANTLYVSKYYTNLLLREDFVQDAYTKTSASIALKSSAWEVALVGNNLGNELITGNCVNGNIVNGIVIPGQITGSTTSGPAGVDELGCNVERGREVWIRLTWRPMAAR